MDGVFKNGHFGASVLYGWPKDRRKAIKLYNTHHCDRMIHSANFVKDSVIFVRGMTS